LEQIIPGFVLKRWEKIPTVVIIGSNQEAIVGITSLIVFLIIGGVAGWLAGLIVKGYGFGLIGNVIVGVVGAFFGSWLLGLFGIFSGGGILGTLVGATLGAVVLLFALRFIRRAV